MGEKKQYFVSVYAHVIKPEKSWYYKVENRYEDELNEDGTVKITGYSKALKGMGKYMDKYFGTDTYDSATILLTDDKGFIYKNEHWDPDADPGNEE